jgi:teichuronic acid biosynthesis glycosyltransferase TuaH
MQIVFLSHTGRSSPFRIGSHHLARELSRLGHRVAHVSNPISLAHVAMLRDPEVRSRARMAFPLRLSTFDGAQFAVPWSVFPLTPDPLRHPITLGSTRLLMRRLQHAGFDGVDLLLVDQPLLEYLIRPLHAAKVVYRPTDINADPLARAAEDRVMKSVSGVVATSTVVADALRTRFPSQAYQVVENGAEISHFVGGDAHWADRRGAVYVGALDRRFDWAAVIELARARPEESVDLYGPAGGVPPELPSNVRLLGAVDYAMLPDILRRYRVGLLPLNDDPTNSGRSPMKLYEYLAGGLNVVTRSTYQTAGRRLTDVYAYQDIPSATAAYARALVDEPTGDGAAAAATMDWSARAQLVLAACERF